jgi:hypothetical protein
VAQAQANQYPVAPAVNGSNGAPPPSIPQYYQAPAPGWAGQYPAAPAVNPSNGVFPPSIQHDYPGPALRGGGGGG